MTHYFPKQRSSDLKDGDAWNVSGGSRDVEIEVAGRLQDLVLPCVVDGRAVTVPAERRGPALRLGYAGAEISALVLRPHAAALAGRMPVKEPPDLSRFLLAPMTGVLMALPVAAGPPGPGDGGMVW